MGMEMFCLNVSILVLIVCYSFARCYHYGEQHRGQGISLYYFLQLPGNLQLSQNRKLKKKKGPRQVIQLAKV